MKVTLRCAVLLFFVPRKERKERKSLLRTAEPFCHFCHFFDERSGKADDCGTFIISCGWLFHERVFLSRRKSRKNGNLYSALRSFSVISVISVGLLLYHATGFSTKEYFCPTERTERTEIFTPHCGAFLSFLSFLRDDYYLMRIVFYCPTEIKEIAEIIVTGPREALPAISASTIAV